MTDLKVKVGESPENEMDILRAEIEALKAEKAERKAKEDRLAKIAATEGFKPTRAKLFVRRTADEVIEEIVPDADVFDDIELQEIIRKATGLTRAFTDEDKLATYKDLKAKGFTDITYNKDKESVVGTAPVADANVNEDPNVVEEADNTDVAGETVEPEDTDNAES
ncbi:MAG: hypothetical protein ACSLFH_06375 [Desulfuromonadales bacterium]